MIKFSNNNQLDLGMLFLARCGGALVTLIFVPIYFKMLGTEKFGVVSLVLAMQALFLMLDFGISTIVGRDIASLNTKDRKYRSIWHNGEILLSIFYIGLGIISILYTQKNNFYGLSQLVVLQVVILLWAIVLQNLSQTVLLSAHYFKTASSIQFLGNMGKGALTVLALYYFGNTIQIFICAQLLSAILQLYLTRNINKKIFKECGVENIGIYSWTGCVALAKKCKSLMLFSFAGAAVMQLDKLIIAKFISTNDVAEYYLAVVFCMLPISFLAGPISQFFQPKIIQALMVDNKKEAKKIVYQFVYVLVTITTIFSAALWFYRAELIELWLGNSTSVKIITSYTLILLPGVAIGAFGYVPYILLTAFQEYRFQSIFSTFLSIITLIFVMYYSINKDMFAICWIYAFYHVSATIFPWIYTYYMKPTRDYSAEAAIVSIKLFTVIIILFFAIKSIYNLLII